MSNKRVLVLAAAMLLTTSLACNLLTVPAAAPQASVPYTAQVAEEAPLAEEVAAEAAPQEAAAEAAPAPAAPVSAPPPPTRAPAAAPTPADMFFKDYGVNPFIDTEDDHLSTFAMDVDTGSYTLTRSYINDGNLPPQDAVRVEEFINYFDQEYPYPPEGKAFAISIDGAPFPFSETEKYQMLRVGIQGYDVPKDQRKDLVLTFVVDSSGSMLEGGRMDLVKRALASLTGELRDADTVSIVAYSESARVVLEPTSGGDTGAIMDAIYQLEPMRSTNAEAGLRLGYEMADRAYDPEAANRVVLLSDGVANVGATGPKAIMAEIERFAEDKDITLTSVGVGMGNYNDVLMEQLADQGNGFYAYVDTPEEARRIFEDKLTGSMQTIAQDAKVQVDFNPEVVARYRLIGFENRAVPDSEFREPDTKGGGIGAGHQVTALYEIKLHPDAGGKVATVFLRWKDPETQEVIEIEQPFDSAELAGAYEEAAPRLQWDVAVAELAEVLRGSPWAGENTIAGVLEEAERVARMFPEDEDVTQFVELVRKASQIPQPEE